MYYNRNNVKLTLRSKIFSNSQQQLPKNAAWQQAYNTPSIIPVYDDRRDDAVFPKKYTSPEQVGLTNNFNNPVATANYYDNRNETYQVLTNFYAQLNLIPDKLNIRSSYSYDYSMIRGSEFTPTYYVGTNQKKEVTELTKKNTNYYKYIWDNVATYTDKWGKHSFTGMLGASMRQEQYRLLEGTATNVPEGEDVWKYIALGNKEGATVKDDGWKYRGLSYFTRLNYNYNDKYMLMFTFRADGSSKYNDKWGYFPSIGAAWVISQEPFMKNQNIFDYMKLRASWGMTGNQEGIGNYDSRSLANGGHNYNGQDGIAITTLANPDLKWEKSDQTNIGLDLSLFNDRVTVGMDYFIKNTKDLLYDRPLHTTTGFSSITQNIGSMRNTGFEFNVESHNIMNDRFSWDTQFNISTIKNKLTSLIDEKPIPVGNHVLQVGQPIGSFYMYKMDGIYQDNQEVPEKLYAKGVRAGDIKYADKDNDGDLTPADKEIVGKPLPDFFGGLTNRFRYGNFDLTIFNTFSVGNDVYATGMGGIDAVGHNNYGMRKDIAANRWTGPGTNNSIPRAMISTHNTQASTYLLHDGSYFKFKDVTLGYTLPSNLTQKLNISNMRVYLSAQNLWTISSYPGYDPEVSYSVNNSKTMGEDAMTVPQLRTFVCGFNLTF